MKNAVWMQIQIQLVIVMTRIHGIQQHQRARNHQFQIVHQIMIAIQWLHVNQMHLEF